MKKSIHKPNQSAIYGGPETSLEIAKRHQKDFEILCEIAELLDYEFFDRELETWKEELYFNNLDDKIEAAKAKANAFYKKVINETKKK